MAQAFRSDEADEVKRLRQLETENARLNKILVERDLEIDVMREIVRVAAVRDHRIIEHCDRLGIGIGQELRKQPSSR